MAVIQDWSDFIARIRAETGLSAAELAKALDVRPQLINDIEKGRSKNPSSDFLLRLINRIGLNPGYLAGDPRLLIPAAPQSLGSQIETRSVGALVDELATLEVGAIEADHGHPEGNTQSVLRLNGRKAIELAVVNTDPEIGYVDYYREQGAGMGPGKDVQEYAESIRLPIIRQFLQPYSPEQVRALEARGDSMSKIGIFDRDIVLFVPTEQEGDGVYVISRDNKLQVKRLEFDITDKELRIISENDRYQPKVLHGEDANSIVIEGKVIGWLHRHPY